MELPLKFLCPEIILLAAACVSVLLGLATSDAVRKLSQVVAAVAALAAFLVACSPASAPDSIGGFYSPYFVTLLTTGIGFLSVLVAWDMPSKSDPSITDTRYRGEFFAMMLFSLAGVSMVGKVNDLVWLFIVLELVSIPTYIMVATGRSQIIAQEAGVKYFFLGALSAAVYLFGFSYLYGFSGSTRFADISAAMVAQHANGGMSNLALIGLLMVIVGVSYKIAAVPLHFYAADVYQGAATPVTAFLAFAPKAAGMVAIIQMLTLAHLEIAGPQGNAIVALLAVMAALTMTVGNVLALLQRTSLKRMFAYSSIAHSGYMLVGIVSGIGRGGSDISNGYRATLFYLGSYAVMNLGFFAVLIYLQGAAEAGEDIDDLAGLSKEHPAAALGMAICLLSLIGMPGTIGFLGKFYIVAAALANGHRALAVIVVLNAAIAAAYYLRVLAALYLRDAWNPFSIRRGWMPRVAATACAIGVIFLGIAPAPLLTATTTGYVPAEMKAAARGAGVNGLPVAAER